MRFTRPSKPVNRHNLKLLFPVALIYGLLAVVNAIVLGKAELCFVRMACGLPCPGCGITHSVIAFLAGHPWESFKYYPFTLLVLATIAGALATFLEITFLPKPIARILFFFDHNQWWQLSLFFAILVFYVIRLILYFPHGPYPMIYSHHNYLELAWNLLQKIWHCVFS